MKKITPLEPLPPKILEEVFLLVDNQLYIIGIGIDEDDRYGELGSVFDDVIESIKVISPE